MSRRGVVEWGLAERIALGVAGEAGLEGAAASPFAPDRLGEACEDATEQVRAYTGLDGTGVPRGEGIGRAEWARSALRTMRELSAPIEERLASGIDVPGPLGAAARRVAGAAAGAEAGAAVGLGARRVLGQFDVALGPTERSPRLYLVGPNLAGAHAELGGDAGAFVSWIATHEVTHAVQFTATPWLRDHLRGELRGLLDAAAEGLGGAEIAALARKLLTTDPRRTLRGLLRGELATALAGPSQRARLERLQAAMTTVEGYAEHVMDAADPARVQDRARLRELLEERRRSRGGLGEVVVRLLGLELKLRQYRVGKEFCDGVVAEGGMELLNRVWASPEALPSATELSAPSRWLERTAAALA